MPDMRQWTGLLLADGLLSSATTSRRQPMGGGSCGWNLITGAEIKVSKNKPEGVVGAKALGTLPGDVQNGSLEVQVGSDEEVEYTFTFQPREDFQESK